VRVAMKLISGISTAKNYVVGFSRQNNWEGGGDS
jgi:hypothetical protein